MDPYGGSGLLLGVPLAMIAMQQLSTGINMVLAGSRGANFAKEFAWGLLLILVLALGRTSPARRVRELLRSLQQRPAPADPES
jgi:ribose/xylose/arabinose/galactoside ABC-type transport system permease subunit